MGLQCGIVGLTNSGKTTLFNCLSSHKAETSVATFNASKSNVGLINVPDTRLNKLAELQPTEKVIPTVVEILDIPGLAKGASKGEGVGNKFLSDIRNTDAIIHVLRCFDDDNLPHIEGSVDPVRDLELVDFELQVKDIETIEKRLNRWKKVAKSGDKEAKQAIEMLNSCKEHLENMESMRNADVSEKAQTYIDDLFLLTSKPVLYVCNVDDESAISGNEYVEKVKKYLTDRNEDAEVLIIAAALEAEISELESAEDRVEFLADAGLSEPGVNKLVRAAYDHLNLRTFFTVGPKEIRAWTIKKGMAAPDAAGVIHSDLKRGFIRAEVMAYNDFTALGSESACRDKGKLRVEGKNYIVDDGDILHIRFNV